MTEAVLDRRTHGVLPPGTRVLVGLGGLALGGCQINAIDLVRTLRARGTDVEVFAVADDEVAVSVLPYAEQSGVGVHVLPAGGGLAVAASVRRLAVELGADVLHVFAPWLGPASEMVAASSGVRAAVITNWTMHNELWSGRRAAMVVGTGGLRGEAIGAYAGTVELMVPPIDLDLDLPDPAAGERLRAERQIEPDETLLVLVTRLDEAMKTESVEHAMDAVALLGTPYRLLVVGTGTAAGRMSRRAAEVNRVAGRKAVVMGGFLADPRPAYDAADLVLGMGGSALRAMAHRKPVVVLGEDGFAMTFEPGSLDHFETEGFFGRGCAGPPVEHLARLVRSVAPEVREELGAFGREHVSATCGLEASVDQLEAIYARELAHARRARLVRDGAAVALRTLARRAVHRTEVA